MADQNIGAILVIVAILDLVLAFWFFLAYTRVSYATRWYGLFSLSVALYVGANGLGYLNIISSGTAESFAWAGGMLTAVFFLSFSYTFPVPTRTTASLFPWVFWPGIIFLAGFLGGDIFIQNNELSPTGYSLVAGQGFYLAVLIFITYWTWSIINLLRSMSKTDGRMRLNLKIILFGVFVSLLTSIVFDILLPIRSVTGVGYLGSVATTIWLFTTTYIIVKA